MRNIARRHVARYFVHEREALKHDPRILRNVPSDLEIFSSGGWQISLFVVWTSREMIRGGERVKRGWRGANWKRPVKMALHAENGIDIFISRFHVPRRPCLRFSAEEFTEEEGGNVCLEIVHELIGSGTFLVWRFRVSTLWCLVSRNCWLPVFWLHFEQIIYDSLEIG